MSNDINIDTTRKWLERELEVRIPKATQRRAKKRCGVRFWTRDDCLGCMKCHRWLKDHPDMQIGALVSSAYFSGLLCVDCLPLAKPEDYDVKE